MFVCVSPRAINNSPIPAIFLSRGSNFVHSIKYLTDAFGLLKFYLHCFYGGGILTGDLKIYQGKQNLIQNSGVIFISIKCF